MDGFDMILATDQGRAYSTEKSLSVFTERDLNSVRLLGPDVDTTAMLSAETEPTLPKIPRINSVSKYRSFQSPRPLSIRSKILWSIMLVKARFRPKYICSSASNDDQRPQR